MAATVSTRWYFSDWMSDENVRACSLAGRGLWMDLLCIASSNKGREYGFIMIAGKILGAKEIARRVGATQDEVEILLKELEENGVYSVDRRGVIYCRRMVRSEKNRTNGRLGGNPNLLNNKENQDSVNHSPKPLIPEPEPNPLPSGRGDARPPSEAKPKRNSGTTLPADWMPGERDYAYGAKLGLTVQEVDAIGEEMKLWAAANANRAVARKANWTSTYHGWMRRDAPKIIRQRQFSNGDPRHGETRNTRGPKLGANGLAAKLRRSIEESDGDQAQFGYAADPAGGRGHRFAKPALVAMDRTEAPEDGPPPVDDFGAFYS